MSYDTIDSRITLLKDIEPETDILELGKSCFEELRKRLEGGRRRAKRTLTGFVAYEPRLNLGLLPPGMKEYFAERERKSSRYYHGGLVVLSVDIFPETREVHVFHPFSNESDVDELVYRVILMPIMRDIMESVM